MDALIICQYVWIGVTSKLPLQSSKEGRTMYKIGENGARSDKNEAAYRTHLASQSYDQYHTRVSIRIAKLPYAFFRLRETLHVLTSSAAMTAPRSDLYDLSHRERFSDADAVISACLLDP